MREITRLLDALSDYDKQRTVYSHRYKAGTDKGRFGVVKRRTSTVAPGLESSKRSMVGPGVAAVDPACNRLVAALCEKLCSIHSSPKKTQEGTSLCRWSLVIHDYRYISEMVLDHPDLKDRELQLVNINQKTLASWYNHLTKERSRQTLLRGTDLPAMRRVGEGDSLPARSLHAEPPQYAHQELHALTLKENKAGQAAFRQKQQTEPILPKPSQPGPSATIVRPSATVLQPLATVLQPSATVVQPSATVVQPSAIMVQPPFMGLQSTILPAPLQQGYPPYVPFWPGMMPQVSCIPPTAPVPFPTLSTPSGVLPVSTAYARQKREAAQDTADPVSRKKRRPSETPNKCRVCGQFKVQSTGHSQTQIGRKRYHYCPLREGQWDSVCG